MQRLIWLIWGSSREETLRFTIEVYCTSAWSFLRFLSALSNCAKSTAYLTPICSVSRWNRVRPSSDCSSASCSSLYFFFRSDSYNRILVHVNDLQGERMCSPPTLFEVQYWTLYSIQNLLRIYKWKKYSFSEAYLSLELRQVLLERSASVLLGFDLLLQLLDPRDRLAEPELYTRYTKSSCFVFGVSLFVYFNTRNYIKRGLAKYTGTRKYIKKGLSKNTRYTKYRTIGLIRIHDNTQKFRQYTNIKVNE